MLRGPDIMRACRECGGAIAQPVLRSGNTFGARLWTDGFRRAPMLPMMPWLVECPHCKALLWIDEQQENPAWESLSGVPVVRAPAIERFRDMLVTVGGDRRKEAFLRRHLWWDGNHARRDPKKPQLPLGEAERENLMALVALLGVKDPEDRIFRAEALRELGEFDQALAVLDVEFDDEYEEIVQQIRRLARERNPWVAER